MEDISHKLFEVVVMLLKTNVMAACGHEKIGLPENKYMFPPHLRAPSGFSSNIPKILVLGIEAFCFSGPLTTELPEKTSEFKIWLHVNLKCSHLII